MDEKIISSFKDIKGFFFDLDGVLVQNDAVIPGAIQTLLFLEERRIPYRVLTNRSSSRDTLHAYLADKGFPVRREEIFSAPQAAVHFLRRQGHPSCCLMMKQDPRKDFVEFQETEDHPDYVIIGDMGETWAFSDLNKVFNMIMNGSQFMALHKGRYWKEEIGFCMDIGVVVAGLEYISGKKALVMGKPSQDFFSMALEDIGMEPRQVAMLGDDILCDVAGAQDAGLLGVLCLSGKYSETHDNHLNIRPDVILPSIADLHRILGYGGQTP